MARRGREERPAQDPELGAVVAEDLGGRRGGAQRGGAVKSPAPAFETAAGDVTTEVTGTRSALAMSPGGLPGWRQPASSSPGAVPRPPTMTGSVVEVCLTLEPAMKLIAMKAPSVTTAITRTVIAGRMLVVVVRGARTSALTRPSRGGRSARGRGRAATPRRRRARRARRPWRRAPRRARSRPSARPAAMRRRERAAGAVVVARRHARAVEDRRRPPRSPRRRARASRWRRPRAKWPPLTTTQRGARARAARAPRSAIVVDRAPASRRRRRTSTAASRRLGVTTSAWANSASR